MKVEKLLKSSISAFIFVSCLIFATWQSYQCFERFLEEPQSTLVSVEKPSSQIFPIITMCPQKFLSMPIHQKMLQDCGIANMIQYKYFGQWIGNCSDPKALYEKLVIPRNDLIDNITYTFFSGPPSIFNQSTLNELSWSQSGSDVFGRCYHLKHSKAIIKDRSISEIVIQFKQDVEAFVHSPGIWKSTIQMLSFEIHAGFWNFLNIRHDGFHMLDYLGEPCVMDEAYDFDQCNTNELDKQSLDEVGCTSPFGSDTDHICRNATQGAMAHKLHYKYFGLYKRLSPSCKHPCNYVTTAIVQQDRIEADPSSRVIDITFQDKITVITSQYIYSGLSMVAEIGGYVGLFLGVSINQISDVLNYVILKLVRY